jgi:hypothetical protein
MIFLFFCIGLVAIFGAAGCIISVGREDGLGCFVYLVLLLLGIGGIVLIYMHVPNFQPSPFDFILIVIGAIVLFLAIGYLVGGGGR